jgi:hypothetical protein
MFVLVAPGLTVVLLLPWILEVDNRSTAMVLAAQAAVCAIGMALGWSRGARPIQLILFTFLLAYLAVAPLYQLAHRRAAWGDFSAIALSERSFDAALLILLTTSASLVGFALSRGRHGSRPSPSSGRGPRPSVRPTAAWATLLIASVLTPGTLSAAGGLQNMFSTRVDRSQAIASQLAGGQTGLSYAVTVLLPAASSVAAFILFLYLSRSRSAMGLGRVRASHAFGLVVSSALLMVHANPFTASRFLMILVAGSAAIVILAPRSGRAGLTMAAVGLFGVLLVYPLLNFFRYGGVKQLVSGWDALASPDFDGFQQVANAIAYTDDHGIAGGRFTLSGLLFFIPRSIWAGKSEPASVLVARDRGYDFTNLSMPIGAELFLDAGTIGCVALMAGLGFVLGKLDTRWLTAPGSRAAAVVPVVAIAMLGVVRGPIGASAPIYLSVLLPVIFGLRSTPPSTSDRPQFVDDEDARAPLSRVADGMP